MRVASILYSRYPPPLVAVPSPKSRAGTSCHPPRLGPLPQPFRRDLLVFLSLLSSPISPFSLAHRRAQRYAHVQRLVRASARHLPWFGRLLSAPCVSLQPNDTTGSKRSRPPATSSLPRNFLASPQRPRLP
ncbi:unnamed protein product [Chondrus crispus]|uniref:Uncharacterized protein n=1 Tax=Chondrus crispus TaxID=2769 RepID=R7Q3L7_CHOCR|nr:unnamed protein product [Chondrus crispus]CDF32468.1 unnamed protein product [Chondrus crispus]|eukprot:XP_005712133.1 unnamed protein product [Chondrus crispus]